MSFNDPIATAIVEIEPVASTAAFNNAARQAAENFDRQFGQASQRVATRINASFANITAGVRTTAQVIAARLPAAVTQAANVIATRLGQAFGTVRAAAQQLNASANQVFTAIQSGAVGAAIAITALSAAAIKVTRSFAGQADEFNRLKLSIEAVISASNTANITANELITQLRAIGAESGFASTQLLAASQQMLALGFSGSDTVNILDQFTQAAARTGASNQQMQRALDGLTQIASKGTLQMEELRRQIAGNLPGAVNLTRVFEIMAQNMGVSTTEIQKLQAQGLLTANIAIPAITQAMEEMNSSVDAFGIRAQSISGLLGILRENFNQIVQTSFQPFIQSLVPTIKGFVDQLKTGTGPFKDLNKDIGDFAKTMGEAVGEIATELVPLLPRLFTLFAQLTKAIAPVVVEIVKIGAAAARLLLPALSFVAQALDILLNRIPILSTILRTLLAGAAIGGVVRAFTLFGRAVGSAGGLLGRIATPVTKLAQAFGGMASTIFRVATGFGFLRGPIEAVAGFLGNLVDRFIQFIGILSRLPGIKQAVSALKNLANSLTEIGDKSEESEEKVKDMGSTLVETLGQMNKAFEDAISKQDDLLSAQEKVKSAEQKLIDLRTKHQQDIQKVREAEEQLGLAREKLQEVNVKLAELEAERLELINDTTRDVRELTDAENDLTRVEFRLTDLELERLEILEKIAELQTPASAEELAIADRKVERAKLALNRAIREEQALLNSLNEEQRDSVDLSGLTLDQLRTQLAGIRASLAAQRAVKKETKSQAELEEERIDARLSVLEAEQAVKDAVAAREKLDRQVIDNQREIEGLTRRLIRLEFDKKQALFDQQNAIRVINDLRNGETARAKELKGVEDQIIRAKQDQARETRNVRDAEKEVRDRAIEVRNITAETREINKEIRLAVLDRDLATARIKGNEQEINRLLLERFRLNGDLIRQSPEILARSLQTVLPTIFANNPALPFIQNNPAFARQVADLILNNPNKLRELFRIHGFQGFAEGGLITSPMVAKIGEGFKHEMVLPLTKPNRVWDLMSKTLPKYPGAMRAAQNAISPGPIATQIKPLNLGSNRVVPRNEGPATYGQIQELINLLKEQRTEVRIEAPITLENNGSSESLLARKISRQLKREILDELGKR